VRPTGVSEKSDGYTLQIGSVELLVLVAIVFGVVFVLPMAVLYFMRRNRRQEDDDKILTLGKESTRSESWETSDVDGDIYDEGHLVELETEELEVIRQSKHVYF